MSTAWRRVLKVIGAIVIAAGLVGVGFFLGRNTLIASSFFPDRARFNVIGPGFGLGSIVSGALTILVWVFIIGGIVWLVGGLTSNRTVSNPPVSTLSAPESALDILKKRYARGEITKAEYDELRRDLGT